jgi:Leucine-rich repeat (LRR) protein
MQKKKTRIDAFITCLNADNPGKNFDSQKRTILSGTLNITFARISPVTLEKCCDLIWLTDLKFTYNQLRNLPESIGNLVNLTVLNLSSNCLQNLPDSFCNLVNLTTLNLSCNQLQNLPDSFGNLVNLTDLELSSNKLQNLPESISNLVHLKFLSLSENQLSTLPESIGNFVHLTTLALSENQLSTLPESIGNLVHLTNLILSENQLSTLPEFIGNLEHLTTLALSENQLSNLPEFIGNLVHLTNLILSSNQLSNLPESIGNLVHLTNLILSSNQLSNLPESIGNLVHLTNLSISRNRLTNLPASFADLRHSIRIIDLKENPLQRLGLGNVLGEEDLQRIFGDRVNLPRLGKKKYNMIPITEKALYQKLDEAEIAINRNTIKDYRMEDVPNLGWDSDIFMKHWQSLLGLLILEDAEEDRIKNKNPDQRTTEEKNYVSKAISYELLANDFKDSYPGLSNSEKIKQSIFPRLNGFLKTMWGLPLEENEQQGWQMYEGSIPELMRNLSYIVSRMIDENLDPDSRHVLMSQLSNALFHCPTGQKEGIEVILLSLMTELKGEGLMDKIFELLAREKNLLFKSAIMPGSSGQNVHILSVYFEKLKDILGLNGYFKYFVEKMGAIGGDPFQGSLGNALEVFYAKFNPDYLVKFIQDHVENDVDFELRQTYLNMLDNASTDPENMKEVETYLKQAQKERPLLIGNVSNYLSAIGILKFKDRITSLGWKDYFESDPMGEKYPKIKIDGIQKILILMNVLKQNETDVSSSSSCSSSVAIDEVD